MDIKAIYSMNNQCLVQLISTHLISEKHIRSMFENEPNVTFTQGVTLTNITEDADSVTITYEDDTGTKKSSKVLTLLNLLIPGKVPSWGRRKSRLRPKTLPRAQRRKTSRF
jgi:hypothetical protein